MKPKLLLSISLLAVSVASFASDADKKALISIYAASDKAIARKDVKGAMASTSPDCVWIRVENGEKATYKDIREQLTNMFKSSKSCKASSSIKSIVVNGKTATVKTVTTSTIVMRNARTKEDHVFVAKGDSTATWVKSGNKWLLKKVLSGKISRTIDGRPMARTSQLKKPRTD
mgnify:FL=1